MKFKNELEAEHWNVFVLKNSDSYGSGVVRYAQKWAEMMEEQMKDEFKPEMADETSHTADVEGITGFMYGCTVGVLSEVWIWGDQLKRWHNKQYGKEDAKGVINPAILTIGEN